MRWLPEVRPWAAQSNCATSASESGSGEYSRTERRAARQASSARPLVLGGGSLTVVSAGRATVSSFRSMVHLLVSAFDEDFAAETASGGVLDRGDVLD